MIKNNSHQDTDLMLPPTTTTTSQHDTNIKFHSLPRKFKQSQFSRNTPLQTCLSGVKVDPTEFRKRLSVMMDWVEEFSDDQMTLLVSALSPHLGASQLHFLSSQLPEHNPGLHHLCVTGCSDPLSLLPGHLALSILSMLSPTDLATATRVCSTWRHLALTSSLWQALCR